VGGGLVEVNLTRREVVQRLGGLAVVTAIFGGVRFVMQKDEPGAVDAAGNPLGAESSTMVSTTLGGAGAGSTVSEAPTGEEGASTTEAGEPGDGETTTTHDHDGSGSTVVAAPGAELSGALGPLTIAKGSSAMIIGDIDLRGDLVIEGSLTGIDTFTIKGNGFQIAVQNGGTVDLRGKPKTGWIRGGSPSGWKNGDRVAVASTVKGTTGVDAISTAVWPVTASSVTLIDGKKMVAEVMNLDRTIVIDGVSRIMFHMGAGKQTLKHIAVRNAGRAGDLGFYPVHFHKNGSTTRGSVVEGVVVENGDNHAFVPHGSHGISLTDCAAVNTTGTAYWWDGQETASDTSNYSEDTLYRHCIAAGVSKATSEDFRLSGFVLRSGPNNSCIDCTTVGIDGNKDSSGFHWPEDADGAGGVNVWVFEDCVAHNNSVHGIFTWQNDGNAHRIDRFVAYHNGDSGIDHGAYVNDYVYADITLHENSEYSVQSHAVGGDKTLIFEDLRSTDPLLIDEHTLEGSPVLYRRISVPRVIVNEEEGVKSHQIFEDSGLTPTDFDIQSIASGTVIEIIERGNVTSKYSGGWQ
jgi:hypothetical protein